MGGVAAGIDGEISSSSRVGVALVYSKTTIDSNSNHQNVKMDGYQLVGYGTQSLNANTDLGWQADYGSNKNKGNRNLQSVGLNSASADYSSTSIHLGANVEHSMAMGAGTMLTPTVKADYTKLSENAYTDSTGSMTNSRKTNEFIIGVAGKVSHALSDSTKLIGNLGVDYNTNAKQSSINTTLPGGSASFTAQGVNPSKTTIVGGVGVLINTSKATEVTARYDIASRSGYNAQTVSVKVKMPF